MEDLELTKEWDKIFPKSYKVNHSKVTFRNRYGITLAADMYTPKNINGKMAAIAISGLTVPCTHCLAAKSRKLRSPQFML